MFGSTNCGIVGDFSRCQRFINLICRGRRCCGTSACFERIRVCDASEGAAATVVIFTSMSVLHVSCLSAPGSHVLHSLLLLHLIGFLGKHVRMLSPPMSDARIVLQNVVTLTKCLYGRRRQRLQMGVQTRPELKTSGNDSFIPRLEKNVSL